MMHIEAIRSARELLDQSIITYQGEPIGTAAACDPSPVAANYEECFVRDFVPSAIVFLLQGRSAIVRNFLLTVLRLRSQLQVMAGHQRAQGLMPASFRVVNDGESEQIVADFGDRAIGRVAPVDSAMWWMFLLRAYRNVTGDQAFVERDDVQEAIRLTLDLYLKESFESAPTMLVPDASFMIDRRMGVYGHPLEIQSLYYAMLTIAGELLQPGERSDRLLAMAASRLQSLRSFVRLYYWLDRNRLNDIHRYQAEEFGTEAVNVLNVYPETIPQWLLDGWLPADAGYLVGNVGPGRIDFRFFALGNHLAILFGLATHEESAAIMNLYTRHWETLVGEMPLKLCYPALAGAEWRLLTGSDPKNAPWSYHNGGNWPVLLWTFVAAAMRAGRDELAIRAWDAAARRLPGDGWPEYYDGVTGSLIGRRSNFHQVWSATAFLIAHHLLEEPESRRLFNQIIF